MDNFKAYIENPFEKILQEIWDLKRELIEAGKIFPAEIIDRQELQRRLGLTEPTVIRWERRGKIPAIRIGSAVRYNWPAVVKALEK
jgi:excisionase family DNA binding protein